MERADHLVAFHGAVGERAAGVWAAVLERVELVAAAEDGDLRAIHRERLARPFLEVVHDHDWLGGVLVLGRGR